MWFVSGDIKDFTQMSWKNDDYFRFLQDVIPLRKSRLKPWGSASRQKTKHSEAAYSYFTDDFKYVNISFIQSLI